MFFYIRGAACLRGPALGRDHGAEGEPLRGG